MLAASGSVAAALAAAVAVVALKIATAVVLRPAGPPRPRLLPGSAAAGWLERAERAVDGIGRIAPGRESSLAERFSQTRDGARETVVLIRRLASHELIVSQVVAGIDPRMAEELHRLERERADAATPEMDEEIGRAIQAVRDQLAARERLVSTARRRSDSRVWSRGWARSRSLRRGARRQRRTLAWTSSRTSSTRSVRALPRPTRSHG